jgi:hypothetical protein
MTIKRKVKSIRGDAIMAAYSNLFMISVDYVLIDVVMKSEVSGMQYGI